MEHEQFDKPEDSCQLSPHLLAHVAGDVLTETRKGLWNSPSPCSGAGTMFSPIYAPLDTQSVTSSTSLHLPQSTITTASLVPINTFPSAGTLSFSDLKSIIQSSPSFNGIYTRTIAGLQPWERTERSSMDGILARSEVKKLQMSTHASPSSSMNSRRPSDWRSSFSAARKSSHPPSVTVVFAEPERSPPPAGAAARLSRKMSLQSIQSRKRDRDGESVLSYQNDGCDTIEARVEDISNEYAEKRQRTNEELTAPEAESQTADSESRKRRASWFSLQGNSSKQSLNVLNTNPAISEGPAAQPTVVEGNREEANATARIPSPSVPIPIEDRPRDDVDSRKPAASPSLGWFGSLSSKQRVVQIDERQEPESTQSLRSAAPQRSIWFTPQSPPNNDAQKTPSGPSSLGDPESPRPNSPPLTKPMLELISTQTSEIKLAALNPSTSRFSLSMPLLGRPKVPLDKTVMKTGDQIEISGAGSIPDRNPSSSGALNHDTSTNSNASDALCASDAPNDSSIQPASESKPSSWFDYIGFGVVKPVTSSLAPQSPVVEPISPIAADNSQAQTLPPIVQEQQDTDGPHTPTHEGQQLPILPNQAPSSTWYSPWSLYNWYTAPSDAVVTATQDIKTEAEMVKEEALARQDPPTLSAGTENTVVFESPCIEREPENPIASSIASNSRGWMSFFSISRAMTVKSLNDKEGNGMEVMDIDEDESTGIVTTSSESKPERVIKKVPSSKSEDGDYPEPSKSPKDTKPAPPLTSSNGVKRVVEEGSKGKRGSSPAPSKKSIPPSTPRPPNLVLPTFGDTFNTLPRSRAPPSASTTSTIKRTLGYVSSVLFARDQEANISEGKGKGRARRPDLHDFGKELPRAWNVLGETPESQTLAKCKKVVVIGVHGWFPGYAVRTVLGEPTGTSTKFANMMASAVEIFGEKYSLEFEQVTKIPLEGEGKIEHRVQKLYHNLTSRDDWMEALHSADVIFVATHSQGTIVSTHLISQLITDGHIRTGRHVDVATSLVSTTSSGGTAIVSATKKQYVCCLAMCGIHLGPLAYLQKNSFVMPYIQYFESEAAAELFEFQHTESNVSKAYVKAVQHVLDNGVKMLYIASLNDQVVPIYSGVFSCISHPLILRSLYIDGDAYHSSDFLSNLLILLLRIRNAGLSDSGLLTHLSEATAGSLSGVGHSTIYEEPATYSLAVDYLFLVNDGQVETTDMEFETFNARSALNDYEIPWVLRDLLADDRVVYLFSKEFTELRDAFNDWHPRTSILRDLKRKLEPIRRLNLSSRL